MDCSLLNLTGGADLADPDEYLRDIELHRIPELRAQLPPLESGEMRLGERRGAGSWSDITQREMGRIRQLIAEYEAIATLLRREKG
jgi:hypothetical protein